MLPYRPPSWTATHLLGAENLQDLWGGLARQGQQLGQREMEVELLGQGIPRHPVVLQVVPQNVSVPQRGKALMPPASTTKATLSAGVGKRP